MLTEQRYSAIVELVNERGSITINELKEELDISESTARRDITALAKQGKLEKVFGGAIALQNYVSSTIEPSVAQKLDLNSEEKRLIAKFAAKLITPEDFIYIDAGTSTLSLIDFIPASHNKLIVTNGIAHAQLLAAKGKRVILLGGEVKDTTESVIGVQALINLQQFHFTKGFFGTNGINRLAGFTTPDEEEALIKQSAMKQCRSRFVLSDSSKFDVVSAVSFCSFSGAEVITEKIPESYLNIPTICAAE